MSETPDTTARLWVVDRAAGNRLVLVADDGDATVEVERASLRCAAREGDVLRVTLGSGSTPDWASAVVDVDATKLRLEEARATIDRLKRRDPGGDLSL